jgi:hypothetical protein
MDAIKIGSHIWVREDRGYLFFDELVVIGETKLSWVTVNAKGALPYKVPDGFQPWYYRPWYVERYGKKLPKKLKGYFIADENSAKLHNWAISERYHIAQAVERCWEPTILLAVSKLVGHKQPEGM